MKKYFNVNLEFDHDIVDSTIHQAIVDDEKGFVCSVEGNIISLANIDQEFCNVVNASLINICDGSSIALLTTIVRRKFHRTYIGADLFINYIKSCRYRSFFLGNTEDVLDGLRQNLVRYDPNIETMRFETLPFRSVENFDYEEIASVINRDNPDIIWVSLGAPKQEEFMLRLLPHLKRGVMFGFGAIFNFYSLKSNEKRAPLMFLKIKFEWFFRLLTNFEKQWPRIKRIIKIYPKMIVDEIGKAKAGQLS